MPKETSSRVSDSSPESSFVQVQVREQAIYFVETRAAPTRQLGKHWEWHGHELKAPPMFHILRRENQPDLTEFRVMTTDP